MGVFLMKLPVFFALIVSLSNSSFAAPQIVEKRVALVIGNAAYADIPLRNPVNDANDIAAKLRQRGFDVIERKNLKTSQIGRTLREFRSRLSKGATALVFYAGHGIQVKGENYLPTIDADIEGEEDIPNQSMSVRQLLEVLDESKTRLNLVFLDACRNNPFGRRLRSSATGLAREAAPTGTLLSFATRPGSVAADGEGRNGIYTTYLLEAMDVPGQPIELALKQVLANVKRASRGQQEPWLEGNIEGEFYFLPAVAAALAPPASPAPAYSGLVEQEKIDRAVEQAVKRSNEQVARERIELQASMERLIKEALGKQKAALDAEHHARLIPEPSRPPVLPHEASRISVLPTALVENRVTTGVSMGDEWEYMASDALRGKKNKLVLRVKAIAPESVTEEIYWNGHSRGEWVFGHKAALLGSPNEAEFMFSPHWTGQELSHTITVRDGSGQCVGVLTCEFMLKPAGSETISVGAGSFDALRLEGTVIASYKGSNFSSVSGTVRIWLDKESRRLLRQVVSIVRGSLRSDETLELVSIRRGTAAPASVPVVGVAPVDIAPGDEWEYAASDELFGKKQKLVLRVKAVAAQGVMEEIIWNGKSLSEWVFGQRATVLGTPNEVEFMFSPHWNGENLPNSISIEGGTGQCRHVMNCELRLKSSGMERITIGAGSFDAIRLEGHVSMKMVSAGWNATGPVRIWLARDSKRLLKQTVDVSGYRIRARETLELVAIRRRPP